MDSLWCSRCLLLAADALHHGIDGAVGLLVVLMPGAQPGESCHLVDYLARCWSGASAGAASAAS